MIMRSFLILVFLCLSFSMSGQSFYEKYNNLNGRYEYYDSNTNALLAYKIYNNINRRWETTYVNNSNSNQGTYIKATPRTDENFELMYEVARAKQQNYDSNHRRLQNQINAINSSIYQTLGNNSSLAKTVAEKFNSDCVNKIRGQSYDISSNSKTNEISEYLDKCFKYVIETVRLNNESKPTYETNKNYLYSTYFIDSLFDIMLFSEPSVHSDKIYKCPKNSIVYVLSKHGDIFYKVKVDNKIGYISKNYLRRKD